MKVKFSRKVRYVPEWEGNAKLPVDEQIVANMRPAKMGDLLEIVDAFAEIGEANDDTDPKLLRHVVEACSDIVPKYVVLAGLLDEDGAPIELTEALDYLTFTPLMVELLGKLTEISTPDGKDDEEN